MNIYFKWNEHLSNIDGDLPSAKKCNIGGLLQHVVWIHSAFPRFLWQHV